ALKRFEDDGRPGEDLPLLHWSMQDALSRTEDAFYGLFRNLPGALIPALLRFIVFPWGREFLSPRDLVGHRVSELALSPGPARNRLTSGMYIGADGPLAALEAALEASVEAEPIERKLGEARKRGMLAAGAAGDDMRRALEHGIITPAEADTLERARRLRRSAIMVDDFPKDLGRTEIYQTTQPVSFEALHVAERI
ncbi:MAG: acyl-CoA dehydrogenase, partial [Betaproteobacteria bacterium]|nr:acyl-CoA dehydrogenase [Betaproteobacteria bacterium]